MSTATDNLPPVPRDTLLAQAWAEFIKCLRKENYARMTGRAGRMEYWSATIIGTLITLIPVPFLLVSYAPFFILFLIINLGLTFYVAIPLLSVYVRRLHDVGWSAFWIILHYLLVALLFGVGVFYATQFAMEEADFKYVFSETMFHMEQWFRYADLPLSLLSLFLFILTLLPGNPNANKYGDKV